MSLTFHETFSLECENVAKLLAVVAINPSASNIEIAERTGIGIGKNDRKGKVQPTIAYAMYGGIITVQSEQGVRVIKLTHLGQMVMEHDQQIRKPVTQWIFHYYLSRQGSEAEAWSYLIHEFLPHYASFERATLEKGLVEKFGERAKIKSINPGVLLNTYTESKALGILRFLRTTSKQYVLGHPYIPTPYIVGYILAEIWDAKHPTRQMIGEEVLSEAGHLGTTIGLRDTDLQEQLNELIHLGIIGRMREAPPYQIVRQWDDKFSLLRRAYEESY